MWGKNSPKEKSSKKLPVPQHCRAAVTCRGQHLQPSPAVQCPGIKSANPINSTSKDAQACANKGRNRASHPWEKRRGLLRPQISRGKRLHPQVLLSTPTCLQRS